MELTRLFCRTFKEFNKKVSFTSFFANTFVYKAEAVGLIRIMQKEYNKIRTLSTDFVEYLEKYRKLDFFINNFRFIRYLGIRNQMISLRVIYKFSRKIVPKHSVMWNLPVIIPYAVLIPVISSGMNEYSGTGSVFQE